MNPSPYSSQPPPPPLHLLSTSHAQSPSFCLAAIIVVDSAPEDHRPSSLSSLSLSFSQPGSDHKFLNTPQIWTRDRVALGGAVVAAQRCHCLRALTVLVLSRCRLSLSRLDFKLRSSKSELQSRDLGETTRRRSQPASPLLQG
ncbi:hypothetical protein V6N13_042915 [Hibiscus sabdariffa]